MNSFSQTEKCFHGNMLTIPFCTILIAASGTNHWVCECFAAKCFLYNYLWKGTVVPIIPPASVMAGLWLGISETESAGVLPCVHDQFESFMHLSLAWHKRNISFQNWFHCPFKLGFKNMVMISRDAIYVKNSWTIVPFNWLQKNRIFLAFGFFVESC